MSANMCSDSIWIYVFNITLFPVSGSTMNKTMSPTGCNFLLNTQRRHFGGCDPVMLFFSFTSNKMWSMVKSSSFPSLCKTAITLPAVLLCHTMWGCAEHLEAIQYLKDGKRRCSLSHLFPLPLGCLIHLSAPARWPPRTPNWGRMDKCCHIPACPDITEESERQRDKARVRHISISHLDCVGMSQHFQTWLPFP